MKKYTLRFRQVNRDTFEAIRDGRKKVETRAATVKYQNIEAGDVLVLKCGKDILEKVVKKATVFKSFDAILNRYKMNDIDPFAMSVDDFKAAYYSYAGYKEKIKKHGLIALELE